MNDERKRTIIAVAITLLGHMSIAAIPFQRATDDVRIETSVYELMPPLPMLNDVIEEPEKLPSNEQQQEQQRPPPQHQATKIKANVVPKREVSSNDNDDVIHGSDASSSVQNANPNPTQDHISNVGSSSIEQRDDKSTKSGVHALTEDTIPPKPITNAYPQYPTEARAAGVEATIVVSFTVNEDGTVSDIKIRRGHEMFDDAVIKAVSTWRYEPARLMGTATPIAVKRTVKFPFKLAS